MPAERAASSFGRYSARRAAQRHRTRLGPSTPGARAYWRQHEFRRWAGGRRGTNALGYCGEGGGGGSGGAARWNGAEGNNGAGRAGEGNPAVPGAVVATTVLAQPPGTPGAAGGAEEALIGAAERAPEARSGSASEHCTNAVLPGAHLARVRGAATPLASPGPLNSSPCQCG
jgi:hypothetical protein